MSVYATNKKATFDYEVLDKLEAGIVLSGQEVKSVREGNMKLAGSYVTVTPSLQVLLKNASVPPYRFAGRVDGYDPLRPRTLLLKKKEIATLYGKTKEAGLTVIPLSVYAGKRRIKIALAVARGKKAADKRRSIKERELDRSVARLIKTKMR